MDITVSQKFTYLYNTVPSTVAYYSLIISKWFISPKVAVYIHFVLLIESTICCVLMSCMLFWDSMLKNTLINTHQ